MSRSSAFRGAETHPPAEIWGSDDKRPTTYRNDRSFFTVREGKIVYASLNSSKCSVAWQCGEEPQ